MSGFSFGEQSGIVPKQRIDVCIAHADKVANGLLGSNLCQTELVSVQRAGDSLVESFPSRPFSSTTDTLIPLGQKDGRHYSASSLLYL